MAKAKADYRQDERYLSAQAKHSEMVEDDVRRNELFAGRHTGTSGGGNVAEPTIDQLVKKADKTHTETTAVANRALAVLNEAKTVQEGTLAELEAQRRQLQGLDDHLTKVNENLTYSEKILRYMRRCCCCWMCDSCTGADPESQQRKKWERQVDRGETRANDKPKPASAQSNGGAKNDGKSKNGGKPGSSSGGGNAPAKLGFRDPDIKLTPEHQATETRLHTETRKQNEILDQIHNGLGDLLQNARVIGDEVSGQTNDVERLHERVQATEGRLKNVNKKSQLKEFK